MTARSVCCALTMIASLLGAALVLVATSTFGPGVSPDSALYLSAAESVAAGHGYVTYDGQLYAHLPPLYPTLLAVGMQLGLDAHTAARFLNAGVFGLIVLTSAGLFRLHVRSPWLRVGGLFAVLLSPMLLSMSIMVLSEALFILLLVITATWLRRFQLSGRKRDVLLVAVCLALACLQRFAGVIVVAGAAIVILSERRTARLVDRVGRVLVFAVIALTPVTLWVLRNVHQTASSNLPLYPVGLSPADAAAGVLDVLTAWVLPPRWPLATRLAAAFVAVMGGILAWRIAGRRTDETDWKSPLTVPAALTAVYFMSMLGIMFTIHYEIGRLLAPMFVWLVVVALVGLEELSRRLRRAGARVLASALVGISIAWLGYQASRVIRDVNLDRSLGAGAYRRVFQESPTVGWARTTPLIGDLYSNAPEVIYLFAGRRARYGLTRGEDPAPFMSPNARYLLWFDRIPARFVLSPVELARITELTAIAWLSDGAVYRLGPALPAAPPEPASGNTRPRAWRKRSTRVRVRCHPTELS